MASAIPADLNQQPELVYESSRPALGISLREVWAMIYRNRGIFLISLFGCVLLGVLYLLLATPVYRASATVQIEEQTARVLKTSDVEPMNNPMEAERFLQTQLDIVRSRSLALTVAREQRLFGDKAFLTAMGARGEAEATAAVTARQAEEERVYKILADNLKVDLPVDSRVATISFDSPDPRVATKIANSFAANFVKLNLLRKYETSAYAREFLNTRLAEAQQQLERSERQALDYASRQRLIDASNSAVSKETASAPKSLTVQRLVALNSAYSDAVARRIQAQQKWEQARGSAIMSLPEVLENKAIQDLALRRAGNMADYEDQRQSRREEYPTVQKLKAQIDETDRQISTLASSIRNSLRSQYDVAQRQENSLREQIAGLENATLDEQNRNVQLSILQRATETSRSAYDSLLQRYRELSAEAGVQSNNIQIVDKAETPLRPVSPKLPIVLGISLLAGLLAGIASVFVREHLNDTVRSAGDISSKLDLHVLGTVPQVKDGTVEETLNDPKSVLSEAFNSIRASLMLSTANGLPASVLTTSIQPSEGKTTTTFALSTGLARIGRNVCVIDCDLRRPALHHRFGLKNTRGVSEYLTGGATIDEIMRPTGYERVTIIGCGKIPPNPTELLSHGRFGELIAELSDRFDILVVDGPPVLGLADAVMLGSQVEATVLVMESGRNYRGAMRSSIARLQKAGSRIAGVVLTKENLRNQGYGYNYAYQYSYGDASRDADG